MKKSLQLLTILVCLTLSGASLYAVDGTWTKTAATASTWSATVNWAGGIVASGVGFTADFSTINFADGMQTMISPQYVQTIRLADTLNGAAHTLRIRNTFDIDPTAGVLLDLQTLGQTLYWEGNIGGGPLVKTGPGTLQLSGAGNNFAGYTVTISGGILKVTGTSASRLGNADQLILDTGTTLDFNTASGSIAYGVPISLVAGQPTIMVTFATDSYIALQGIMSGSGGLQVSTGAATPGRLELQNAANTFQGPVEIGTGGLVYVDTLADAGTASSLGTGDYNSDPASAVITLSGGGTLHHYGAAASCNRPIALGGGGGIFRNAGGAGSVTLTGGITGTGNPLTIVADGDIAISGTGINTSTGGSLTKDGSGALTLAASSDYTGATTVNAGTLLVNGSTDPLSAVTVQTGGKLGGIGTVGGATTILDGTLTPGQSAGTLTFSSDLTLDSTSVLSYELVGTDLTVGGGVNDLTIVAGTLTLDGTLNVIDLLGNSFQSANVGDKWRLFDYSVGLTDNGLNLGSMPPNLTFAINTATTGQVNLELTAVPEPSAIVLGLLGGLGLLVILQRRRSA